MFIVMGLFLLISVIIFVIYAIRFLIIKTGVALEGDASDENKILRINFDELKKIGIMK